MYCVCVVAKLLVFFYAVMLWECSTLNVFVLILVYTNTIASCLRGLGESLHTCRSSVVYRR